MDLRWDYSRIGGCGGFSFRLPRKIFEERAISGAYNVRIYVRNQDTNAYDLWYQGQIENKSPNIMGNSEDIQISGHGYQAQLSNVYLDNVTYTAQEASVIVKDILDNYIVPNTDITYSAPDIEATSFTFDTITFNTDAMSALQTISDTVGTREWAVRKNRDFVFKARSETVGLRYVVGKNITNYTENQDYKEIVNRVIVQGAQVGGTYFTATYNDLPSQLKYGLRAKPKQNSSITSSTVAEQFADSIFAEFNEAVIKSNFELVGIESQIEATNPIPLVNILVKQDKYGEKKFGEGIYSGLVNIAVNRINYTVTNNNSLKIGIDLGKIRPAVSEAIAQLEYQLEQQRSAAL